MDKKTTLLKALAAAGELNPLVDGEQLLYHFEAAKQQLDEVTQPDKWASVHAMFGGYLAPTNPSVALAAYRVALDYPEFPPEALPHVHAQIGQLLSLGAGDDQDVLEEAIRHLEIGVDEDFSPRFLAHLYSVRTKGDRRENWDTRLKYLQRDLSTIDSQTEPVNWVKRNNEIALAWRDQPDGDLSEQSRNRLATIQNSLDVLRERRGPEWIQTQTLRSECMLFWPEGDETTNKRKALVAADLALAEVSEETDPETHRIALQARANALMAEPTTEAEQAEALDLVTKAASLIDPVANWEASANIQQTRINTLLTLVRSGQHQHLAEILASSANLHAVLAERRPWAALVATRVAGEAAIEAGRLENAIEPLANGLRTALQAMKTSHSISGRLETIHNLGDVAALLGSVYLELGRIPEALHALELGKALVWNDPDIDAEYRLDDHVPPDGALLFGCFARDPGFVAIVTSEASAIVNLPDFGKTRLMELQRGGLNTPELGGWLRAYYAREDDMPGWSNTITQTCHQLSDLMDPVVSELKRLQVTEGAELVWFHQGGSNVFPVHATWSGSEESPDWLIDAYSIRYAPSIRCLQTGSRSVDERPHVMVSDPNSNVRAEDLVEHWLRESLPDEPLTVLRGPDATVDAVASTLASSKSLTFSCHALFSLESPWESGLLLADDQKLTVRACMEAMVAAAPDLVILAACETAQTRVTSYSDEFLGLPAAFLHAGAGTVLASLWEVDDEATAVLIGRFLQERSTGFSSAESLRRAQRWMRDVTAKELRAELKEIVDAGGQAADAARSIRTRLRPRGEEKCYNAPYFWSSFSVHGR